MSTIMRKMVRRQVEYKRQEDVKSGWSILYDLAKKMSGCKGRIKQNPIEFLESLEGELKHKLHSNGLKNHKAMRMFKNQSSYMINSGYIESGIDHLMMYSNLKK
jgi:hypothetical protein